MLGFGCMCIRLGWWFYAGCYGGFCVDVFGIWLVLVHVWIGCLFIDVAFIVAAGLVAYDMLFQLFGATVFFV